MAKALVKPGNVSGKVSAPPSKSYTHRAVLISALAAGPTKVVNPLRSEDVRATCNFIGALGGRVRDRGTHFEVEGALREPENVVDCLNSGTTLRLATGVAGLVEGTTVLTGDASLRSRPMAPLLDAMEQLGARTISRGGRAPVAIKGRMRGGKARITGDVSSQFLSSLLIAGAAAEKGVDIEVSGKMVSRPYLEITSEVLRHFKVEHSLASQRFYAPGGQKPAAVDFEVPGDYSSAAFMLAAGALAGGPVEVSGLREDAQGDRAIVPHLKAFGAKVKRADGGYVASSGSLRGTHIDVGDTPDLFPILCIVAAAAKGESVIAGAKHLRAKESDRIRAVVSLLKSLGVEAQELDDGARIAGGGIKGGTAPSLGDHRIVMSSAVAGLVSQSGVTVLDRESASVSYPEFFKDLRRLGARVDERR
ncbi:MAG: 3-phosphoshikimate 1-carboxyvinyltransferase [Candidatus Rokuibacteriota bacterium]